MTRNSEFSLTRRDWLKLAAAGVVGYSMSGWLGRLAAAAAADPLRRRSCILLWMNGGPSQMDTFDLKPGHANGGPYKAIDTAVPGIQISEHLPRIARHMDEMAIIRSMFTKEADHGRATYQMHTGRPPSGEIQYPSLGSLVAKELDRDDATLPGFVSIAPFRFFSPAAHAPGFLGPQYGPLVVGESGNGFGQQPNPNSIDDALKVQDLDLAAGVNAKRAAARVKLLDDMEEDFLAERSGPASLSHRTAYQRAVTMMHSAAIKAFDLGDEPSKLRDAYGRNLFGQGCLLARRLVEQSVPFVEVTLANIAGAPGWDTHAQNFDSVKKLSDILDPAWSTLMEDLKDRGLLETTLIVWMGEFGRTPKINGAQGRDHWASSWSTVLAGGGIKGGQVVGKTSDDGMEVTDRPVSTPDLLATVALALGLDPRKQNMSNVGRPIRFAEPTALPIKEVVA